MLDRIILPALGKKKIVDVVRADVARLHHAGRDAPYQANRVLAVISKMFNLAEAWGLRPDGSNPCRHVERFQEHGRERMLSGTELARLGEALASYDGSPYVPAAVKLLLFTGARLSEVLGLRWDYVDFERGEARLPDSKTGAKTLHLPPPALAVLATLPRLAGNPYVIVGGVEGAALVNLEKPWRAIHCWVTGRAPARLAPRVCQCRRRQRWKLAHNRQAPWPCTGCDHSKIRPPCQRSGESRGGGDFRDDCRRPWLCARNRGATREPGLRDADASRRGYSKFENSGSSDKGR